MLRGAESRSRGLQRQALAQEPFLEEAREGFESSLEEYVGGAFAFAQERV